MKNLQKIDLKRKEKLLQNKLVQTMKNSYTRLGFKNMKIAYGKLLNSSCEVKEKRKVKLTNL